MNPLLAALVQMGIVSPADAERMTRQLDPAAQRTYAEEQLSAAFARGLNGQQSRLIELLRKADGRPTNRQVDDFWTQEDDLLWRTVQPTMQALATEAAVSAAIRQGDNTWNLVNEDVMSWIERYYTSPSPAFVGSVPNLNQTARQQFADALTGWQRGTLTDIGFNDGLPQLIRALEPIFGEARAKIVGTTEVTRVYAETEVQAARVDEFIEYLQAFSAEDEKVCETCGPVSGQIIRKDATGFDHPTEGNIGFPPYHPACRCWVSPAESSETIASLARETSS